MILIADSGSTKTDWVVLHKNKPLEHFYTDGFNPYYFGSDRFLEILEKQLLTQMPELHISSVHFYGSGCSIPENKETISLPLRKAFPNAHIEVWHDLLGACHALLGHKRGIACILGTGSNSCLYDGQDVIENVPSLGYLYGDEGGGIYIGKRFLRDYMTGYLPVEISKAFEDEYHLTIKDILKESYNNPSPNKFLARFPKFVNKYIENEYLHRLVASCFEEFFEEQVKRYTEYKDVTVNFVGSIAFFFEDILKEVAVKEGITVDVIHQKPMSGLIKYYENELLLSS
ncbi:MAG: hypothetical protein ACEPOV_08860 [Hyphomicrobiales bacterium]